MEIITTMPVWTLWMISGVLLLILEIFTPGFVIGLIGTASILAGISALITNNSLIHFIVFSISSLILMIFIRPITLKYFLPKNKRSSNVDALIGKEVLVTEKIENLKEKGYIKIGADYFMARSEDNSSIEKDEVVIIKKIEGITATVSLKK